MRNRFSVSINNITYLKRQVLYWLEKHETFCYLDNNFYQDYPYKNYELLVAVGIKNQTQESNTNNFVQIDYFLNNSKDWAFGHISYDLKNEIENLTSNNLDFINFPTSYFFQPIHVIYIKANSQELIIETCEENGIEILQEIINHSLPDNTNKSNSSIKVQSRFSKQEYIDEVNEIKQKIASGDFYEINFCMEFYAENQAINPLEVFNNINAYNLSPFSAFYKHKQHYTICSSPERFLAKQGNKIISQPIKGTAKKSNSLEENIAIKRQLHESEKERAENVMIVDLVRNDLSKSCKTASVKVEELFGIYSFNQLHHMVSTISGEVKPDISNVEIIKNAFPMGSMTGAPKVIVMKTIEETEKTKRGIYSGSIGYFDSNGDFDFNVVIRSIIYNETSQYLSFQVGSAITFDSEAEKEHEECFIKAEAMLQVLKNSKEIK